MTESAPSEKSILDSKVALPKHVVYRSFIKETVILNLETGKYHGLSPSGGRMLEVLEKAPNVRAAAENLAAEYNQPIETIQQDITEFCIDLLDRRLIEVEASQGT
jgi:coenzyme PQQ synthesis protein D (PqqD)